MPSSRSRWAEDEQFCVPAMADIYGGCLQGSKNSDGSPVDGPGEIFFPSGEVMMETFRKGSGLGFARFERADGRPIENVNGLPKSLSNLTHDQSRAACRRSEGPSAESYTPHPSTKRSAQGTATRLATFPGVPGPQTQPADRREPVRSAVATQLNESCTSNLQLLMHLLFSPRGQSSAAAAEDTTALGSVIRHERPREHCCPTKA